MLQLRKQEALDRVHGLPCHEVRCKVLATHAAISSGDSTGGRRGRGWPCARWRRSRQRSLATLPRSSSRPSAPERSLQPRTELVAAWPGLRAERLPPVPEDEVAALVQPICSRSAADLQPILEHLRDVVTGPEHLDFCSRSAADPRAPARLRHWAGAPRLPPRLARAAGAGPGTSHVEGAPFLPFQAVSGRFRSTARARLPTYAAYVARERLVRLVYAGAQHRATSRNIPLFYKFLSAAIRQAAECHTERDTIKASTFHSQFHPVPSLGARRQLQHEHDDAEQVRGRPRGADARIGGERSAAGHAHQEAAWRGPTRQVKMHIGVIGMQSLARYQALSD